MSRAVQAVKAPGSRSAAHRRSNTTETQGRPAISDVFELNGTAIDGRYRVEQAIGSGGFGVVYRAIHLRFDSPVAIKVLRVPPSISGDERHALIERLLREGKLLFKLSAEHRSIVRVFEAGTVATPAGLSPYLAMEWLDGVPLDLEIKHRRTSGRSRRDWPELVTLLDELVDAVALAHRRRIAHRDIKPGNIFLVEHEGRTLPKLLDFGLAKVLDESTGLHDTTDDTGADRRFTRAYAAPEQWSPRLSRTGPWTDVYALALVCVELVAGVRALQGSDDAQLMAACLDEAVRPTPRTLGVEVSDAVEAVFAKALAVQPAARYRDAAAFWSALKAALSVSGRVETTRGVSSPRSLFASCASACGALVLFTASSTPTEARSSRRVSEAIVAASWDASSDLSLSAVVRAQDAVPAASSAPPLRSPAPSLPAVVRSRTRPLDPSAAALVAPREDPLASVTAAAPALQLEEVLDHEELTRRK